MEIMKVFWWLDSEITEEIYAERSQTLNFAEAFWCIHCPSALKEHLYIPTAFHI